MNIPTYEKKDYSYLQNAFKGLQQGASQFGQGLATAMTIGEREDKRAREKELLSQLKVTNEQAKKVREVAITELAADIMDALGAGDIPEARDYARSRASQHIYPFTAEELKKGTGVLRVYEQEQNKESLLNKIRMKRVNEKVKGGLQTEQFTPQRTIQEPVGTVSVEDSGDLKRPLETAPTQQEMQRSAESELATQPTYMKTLPRDITADDLLREFPELIGDKKFEKVLEYVGRQDVAGRDWPEGTTQEDVTRQYTQTPYTSEAGYKYAGTFPKRDTGDDMEALKLKKIKQEIELLKKKGVTGDIKEVNKNITNFTKIKDSLLGMGLTYTEKLNRFNLAIEKLKAGQSLSERVRAGLGGDISADPNIEELTNARDDYQRKIDDVDLAIKETQYTLDKLGAGESLPKIRADIAARRKADIEDARNYIVEELAPATVGTRAAKKVWILSDLLKNLPAKHRKTVKEESDKLRDLGFINEDIVNWWLKRREGK